MNRNQIIHEDFHTHIFNGGLTTKVISDVVTYSNQELVRRSYKLQFKMTCLSFPMTVTIPLFSVAQVYDLVKALERTLEHMIVNSDELSDDHKAAQSHFYVLGGEKADGITDCSEDLLKIIDRLKGK
jgi:hypothetical protein